MQDIYTPTKARQNLYNILKDVNKNSRPITIVRANGDESTSAVIVSKSDWEAQQETMALLSNGQLQFSLAHEKDQTEDIDDMLADINKEVDSEKTND
ncbi:type II toxin-antitoxin system Phd/YefM family antitoxin [Pediococcus inopinatus]|uniref:Antitoxin n=1 Tax=Pediococcus inopinatus TaxID=114090 RepID=A0ABZ0Q4W8_9LACO|nr:type II toxin-antitoxin system Phd/YefM family antitoxin [Pediococcus inopinatus]AVK99299.1 hypothetical protein PI20285_00765 [Pediococcus inopinatus]KRN60006.1 hypothetical protein IV83_GL001641 [Pediococcus inopinatus]WPC20339.1 type II toxin-antitoxin system Phd/YefM family antitoxin [Pediococcus inopinatus]WPC22043.1 type II toxin-antitoxin system Phd/YefM family antitoxin [Pediococcus inopinatus]WPP09025.1 type II toxin-antitoxin system Phd/YefM family antitoxin [Pediococcus inopinatu